MRFGAPFWLLALPVLVGVLFGLWRWADGRARAALQGAFQTPLLADLLRSVDPLRRRVKRLLFAAGVAALAFALARPQGGRNELEVERTGVDLIVALDVSRSMLAADVDRTNRLAAAQAAVRRLLGALGGDRVALVVFAGEAFVAAPLTRDHTAVERALAAAGPGAISEPGSNLGEAIKLARQSFERAGPGPRLLLVLSDGEQMQGDAVEAARAAARDGVRVHTAGVGSATGTRLPGNRWEPGSVVRNALGRAVVSRRDEQRLQQMAAAGAGVYTRLEGSDSAALTGWFREASAGLPRTTEKRVLKEPRERFQWALALALAGLAWEWRLGERRPKRAGES